MLIWLRARVWTGQRDRSDDPADGARNLRAAPARVVARQGQPATLLDTVFAVRPGFGIRCAHRASAAEFRRDPDSACGGGRCGAGAVVGEVAVVRASNRDDCFLGTAGALNPVHGKQAETDKR